ncbi:MAG: hypothetical protein OXR64_09890 [Chloroflexota bacterium]|nr:hypothetical protein [Chloroflexota bacterium]
MSERPSGCQATRVSHEPGIEEPDVSTVRTDDHVEFDMNPALSIGWKVTPVDLTHKLHGVVDGDPPVGATIKSTGGTQAGHVRLSQFFKNIAAMLIRLFR